MTSKARSILLILTAVLIAGFTAFAVRSRISNDAPAESSKSATQTAKIITATHDIAAGSFVQAGNDITFTEFPERSIQAYHLREGIVQLADFNGAVASRAIKAGEPMTGSLLIKPGAGGFMAAVLEAGTRAVSIAVTPTSGNAGFVFPGDKVDLILTHKITVTGVEGTEDSVVSETFVRNVRVVAVDQQLDNPENKAILAKTVTVEVTPQQAEKISIAADVGKISVALRSLGNKENEPVDVLLDAANTMTTDRDVGVSMDKNGELVPTVRVFRGDQMQKMQFYREPK